jgi:AcrR family transcriptional regulator
MSSKPATSVTSAKTRKEQSHERIVDAAARAVRARGFAGVGVADVMQEAGLTHGGFYAHFPSRDALLIAAVEEAGRVSAQSIVRRIESAKPGVSPFRALVEGYLSDVLLEHPEGGCPVAALCAEMPRQSAEVRNAGAERVRALVRLVGRKLPAGTAPHEAGVVAATLVGSLQMARVLNGAGGKALLAHTRAALLARYDVA